MSLVQMDGFDHWSATYGVGKVDSSPAGCSQQTGRFSGYSIYCGLGWTVYGPKYLTTTSHVCIGSAKKTNQASGNALLMQLYNATGGGLCGIRAQGWALYFDVTSTAQYSLDYTIPDQSWRYIELEVLLSTSTTGSYSIWIEGDLVKTATSIRTANAAPPYSYQLYSQANVYTDDVYVLDKSVDGTATQGKPFQDKLGPCRIHTLLPSGAGNYAQFTPSTGSNYQNVDDSTYSDEDTTYNTSGSGSLIDTFAFGNLSVDPKDIHALQMCMRGKKLDAGSRNMRHKMRIDSTDYNGASQAIASDYEYHPEIFAESPATSSDWTKTEIDGAEFGYESL